MYISAGIPAYFYRGRLTPRNEPLASSSSLVLCLSARAASAALILVRSSEASSGLSISMSSLAADDMPVQSGVVGVLVELVWDVDDIDFVVELGHVLVGAGVSREVDGLRWVISCEVEELWFSREIFLC